jgi:hypothetical protein
MEQPYAPSTLGRFCTFEDLPHFDLCLVLYRLDCLVKW